MATYPDPFSVDLEKYCVVQPYEKAWHAPYDGEFHPAGPGRERKIYPPSKKPRRIYTGAILQPLDKIRPAEEIASRVDERPLAQLQQQAADALKQMLYRAHCGDKEAIEAYVLATYHAVDSLQTLVDHQPLKVQREAETFSHWPVLLSLNPQDLTHAEQQLSSLGVGSKSLLPTKRGQRVDYRDRWTQLALWALTACAQNQRVIPALKAICTGAKSERKTQKFSDRIEHGATFYQLGNGDVVIITDWQEQCTTLPPVRINEHSFEQWWAVMESCILEHWRNPDGNFDWVLGKVTYADTEKKGVSNVESGRKQGRQRSHALHQIQRSARSLLGLRRIPPKRGSDT